MECILMCDVKLADHLSLSFSLSYGYIYIQTVLYKQSHVFNHKKVCHLMCGRGIHSVFHKKHSFVERKPFVVFPYELNRKFLAKAAMEKLDTNITYEGMSQLYASAQQLTWDNRFRQRGIPLYFSKTRVNHTIHMIDGMLSCGNYRFLIKKDTNP